MIICFIFPSETLSVKTDHNDTSSELLTVKTDTVRFVWENVCPIIQLDNSVQFWGTYIIYNIVYKDRSQ